MKAPIVALALFGICAGTSTMALAQSATNPGLGGGALPRPIIPDPALGANNGPSVFAGNSALPGPIPVDEIKPMTAELPNDAIEPYLLDKRNGPFMVLAKTFRGTDADRMALALAKELRRDFHLPAYVLRTKDFPMKSNIRGVPPTAPRDVMQPEIKQPERVRTIDEAAVLVGDEKTLDGSEKLLHEVKKLHPKCLEGMPVLFKMREGGGLARAIRTTNPYVPAQFLYPKPKDKLLIQMNKGTNNLLHCSGHYSLQVAQFSGRSAYNVNAGNDQSFMSKFKDRQSPLYTAAADAEKMAEKLAKDPDIRRLGHPVYVFHDLTSSQVFIGSFDSPRDPRAVELYKQLIELSDDLMQVKRPTGPLDHLIVPASVLTDVSVIRTKF
jgi:hypothetical protein